MRTRYSRTVGLVGLLVLAGVGAPRIEAGAPTAAQEGGGAPEVPVGFGTVDDVGPARQARTARVDPALQRDPSGATLVEVTGDDAAVATALRTVGAEQLGGRGGLTLARVPNESLDALAGSDGVAAVRAAVRMDAARAAADPRTERGPVTGQHTSLAAEWHQAGHLGAGSKVGIIGLFDATVLDTEISSGELPAIPVGNRVCFTAGATCPFGTAGATYGNSLAEIVADTAPEASLYLAELGYKTDYYLAIDWMAANGVRILLNPEVWSYDGPGDGTGPAAAIIDYAVSKGIAWFNTAGEMSPGLGGVYWRGTWNDPDNDRLLNWSGNDESMTVYCGFLLGLRWNDWGRPLTDYDLLVSDYRANNGTYGTRVAMSAANQSQPGAQPLEGTGGVRLCNHNAAYGPVWDTNGDGFVSLWVQRTTRTPNTPVGDIIELGTYYGWLERYTNGEGSVSHPFADSRSDGMLTVGTNGMVDMGYPRTGWGPTNDGRLKPELLAPGCVATSVDGGVGDQYCSDAGFVGSDVAAAIAAGMAAVTAPVVGAVTPLQITRYVRDQGIEYDTYPERTSLMTTNLHFPAPPPTSFPVSTYQLGGATRLLDTRGAPTGPIGTNRVQRIKAGETFHLRVYGPRTGAVILNVGMVKASGRGYLSIHPSGWAAPGAASALNVEAAGQVRSNLVVVPVGNGTVDIFSSVETDLIVDQQGIFAPVDDPQYSDPVTNPFQPTTPTRIADTRSCLGLAGCIGLPVAAMSWTNVDVGAFVDPESVLSDVPATARAAVVAVTIDSPAAAGYASVLPGDVNTVTTSNLNFDAGRSVTATAIVRLNDGANGVARVFTSAAAHIQVDILGWFDSGGQPLDPSGGFVPIAPRRLLDSRVPTGTPHLAAGTLTTIDAAPAGVPATATAVLANQVAVNTLDAGELQVAATAQPQPPVFRNLSAGAAGVTVAASTITRTDNAQYTIRNTGRTHVISDLWGYFLPPATTPAPEGATVEVPITGLNTYNCCYFLEISDDGSVVAVVTTKPYPGHDHLQIWRRGSGEVLELFEGLTPTLFGLTDDGATALVRAWDVALDSYALYEIDTATGTPTLITGVANVDWFFPSGDLERMLVRTATSHDPSDTAPGSTDFYLWDRPAGTYTLLPMPTDTAVIMSHDGHHAGWHVGSQVTVLDLDALTATTVDTGVAIGSIELDDDASAALVTAPTGVYGYNVLYVVQIATGTKQMVPVDGLYGTNSPVGVMWVGADGDEIAYSRQHRSAFGAQAPGYAPTVAYHTERGTMPGQEVGSNFSANGRFVAVLTISPIILGQTPGVVLLLQDRLVL